MMIINNDGSDNGIVINLLGKNTNVEFTLNNKRSYSSHRLHTLAIVIVFSIKQRH